MFRSPEMNVYSEVYVRLDELLAGVRTIPHLIDSRVDGFIIHQHWAWMQRHPQLFPIMSIENPIKPTNYQEAHAHLTYPIHGQLPEATVPADHTSPTRYISPARCYFTLSSEKEIKIVQVTEGSVVAFWQGVEQPGVLQAKQYTLQWVDPTKTQAIEKVFNANRALILNKADDSLQPNPYTMLQTISFLGLDGRNAQQTLKALEHFT